MAKESWIDLTEAHPWRRVHGDFFQMLAGICFDELDTAPDG